MRPDRDVQADVFVSYAHADNRVPVGMEIGWITALTRNLITHPYTAKCRFYIDHQLGPGDDFTEDLMLQLDRCRILLVVLSQNYVLSPWCGKEVRRFLDNRNDRLSNILVLELSPFEELENVPDSIRRLRGALIQSKFWHREPEEKRITQLGYPKPPSDGKDGYWSRISDLAQALHGKLAAPLTVSPPLKPAARTVLLADVTDDLESDRIAVKAALEKEGVTVLPAGDYVGLPFEEFASAFRKDIARSELFVQLLSKTAGRLQAGFPGRMPKLQFDFANSGQQEILQWCDREVPALDRIQDTEHAALFTSAYLRAVNIEAFKDEILDRLNLIERRRLARQDYALEQQRAEEEAKTQAGGVGAPRLAARAVFVDDEFAEDELAQRIRAIIKSERCIIRSWPKTFPLGQERGADREVLRICRGGLTLYVNKRDQVIVYNRLLYFLNRIAEDQLPLAKWGIYFGPPKDKESVPVDFGIDSDDVIGIAGMEQFNEAALRSFLQSL